MRKFKVAVCQMLVTENKEENLIKAEEMIREAKSQEAKIVVLPEIFNCPYNSQSMLEMAETYPGETTSRLSNLAKELSLYIIGGSIAEKSKNKVYNTSFIFGPQGELLGRHRKMHLFDIDIKGKITFKESDVFEAGDEVTVVDTGFCKIGVAICFDMRFPELMRLMVLKGAEVIIVPAAFNTTTGPAHWHETIKVRAVDNQVYFVAASPARNLQSSYHAYGFSTIMNPFGEVVGAAEEGETIVYGEIDLNYVEKVRQELPLLKNRRKDLYTLTEV
ncbi:carbon-nitrogen hydrolase family protein [Clostridium formicaceticum]|uniref:2-oxoglutaramate amidase n=1 Tax=Clostridium formicaceticum TaxID=1497 RepID=A0AAC9RII1_9CLOT|nr:carbon-nitrogen hydrolase family protein [Clostridium formicaceticum]AOY76294.1 carbon-nitrogen hydrolase [Clostridium formicaceticum]ARE86681.1 2-oxoglutaramate amidase [Clostridium formicaceticum]